MAAVTLSSRQEQSDLHRVSAVFPSAAKVFYFEDISKGMFAHTKKNPDVSTSLLPSLSVSSGLITFKVTGLSSSPLASSVFADLGGLSAALIKMISWLPHFQEI